MVLLTFHVVQGKRTLLRHARPLGDDQNLGTSVALILRQVAPDFVLGSAQVFSDRAEASPPVDLDIESLDHISIKEIADIGNFLRLGGKEQESPDVSSVPTRSAFDLLQSAGNSLPAKTQLKTYDWKIYHALIDQLHANGVGFPAESVCDGGAGKGLLLALKALLQYLLPFDDAGVFKVVPALGGLYRQ